MKKQIRRFPPHQNAKVFAVLIAICMIPFFIISALMMSFVIPSVDEHGNPIESPLPIAFFLLMPVIYMVLVYISVALGCFIYNFLYKFIGGFEVETVEEDKS